jgi:hypothetical protein
MPSCGHSGCRIVPRLMPSLWSFWLGNLRFVGSESVFICPCPFVGFERRLCSLGAVCLTLKSEAFHINFGIVSDLDL